MPSAGRARRAADALHAPPRGRLGSLCGAASCTAIVAVGWWLRDERYLDPESSPGYWLGVAGGSMLLLLLLYSARKRLRILASLGPLRYWFRAHMWLGIAAPTAILLHSNFQLGSLNSSAALASLLLVAASGVVGRVVYARIHYGLYGRRLRLREKRAELSEAEGKLRPLLEVFPEVLELLEAYEKRVANPPRSAFGAIWRLWTSEWQARRYERACNRLLDPVLYEERRGARECIRLARSVAEFGAWERLFRLWHAVHVPLFAVLMISLVVHVVAVHMY